MEQKNKTPQEVAAAIRADFRAQNLNIREAAERIGLAPASLSMALARRSYLGRKIAGLLADTFGYDLSFLYTGAGTLRRADTPASADRTPSALDLQLRQILSICVNNGAALAALQRQVAELSALAHLSNKVGNGG